MSSGFPFLPIGKPFGRLGLAKVLEFLPSNWPNGIIIHQPPFPWNSRSPISLPKRYLFGGNGEPCEVAIRLKVPGLSPLQSPKWHTSHQPEAAEPAVMEGCTASLTWWFRSESGNHQLRLVGTWSSHYLEGFISIPGGDRRISNEPSTVWRYVQVNWHQFTYHILSCPNIYTPLHPPPTLQKEQTNQLLQQHLLPIFSRTHLNKKKHRNSLGSVIYMTSPPLPPKKTSKQSSTNVSKNDRPRSETLVAIRCPSDANFYQDLLKSMPSLGKVSKRNPRGVRRVAFLRPSLKFRVLRFEGVRKNGEGKDWAV